MFDRFEFKMSIYFKIAIFFTLLLNYISAKPLYTYWDNIHIKQIDVWYVKSGDKLLKIDFDNIEVKFKDNIEKAQKDSILSTLHCTIQKVDSRGKYYIKVSSGTEYFFFLRELLYNKNVQNISVYTASGYKLNDSLVTEIRLRDKLYVNKDGKWYASLGGTLYEIIPDILSIKFKKDVSDKSWNSFLEKNSLQFLEKNRLGIFDVKITSGRHAIFYFIELYQNPLLDFIEMNIKENY